MFAGQNGWVTAWCGMEWACRIFSGKNKPKVWDSYDVTTKFLESVRHEDEGYTRLAETEKPHA